MAVRTDGAPLMSFTDNPSSPIGQGTAGVTDLVTTLQGMVRQLSTSNQNMLALIAAVQGSAGSGTVTSVSVTTQNGVSATVTNPTTNPALAFLLGAITPSSVAVGAGSAITSSGPGGVLTALGYTVPGTGVATALGANVGSAGSVLLNESGTWTPTITTDGTVGTPAYSIQVGSYERIGELVIARFKVSLASWAGSPTGNVLVGGLPVASTSTTNDVGQCQITVWSTGNPFVYLSGWVQPSSTSITIFAMPAAATGQGSLTAAALTSTGLLSGVAIYRT